MPGAPASISVVSGPFSAPINTPFAGPFVAKVTDANGNPVSGVTLTFWPQGRDGSCTFAGGVNTAVTDVNGLATSAVVTAGGTVGFHQVQAWVGTWPPAPGAVGPAIFSLSNSSGYVTQSPNRAAILAAWATAKA
jgi:adhesin/invasin